MRLSAGLGARELEDTYVSGLYAEAGAWLIAAHMIDGRYDKANAVGLDAAAVADRILAQRPGDRTALYAQGIIQSSLGDAAASELRPQQAIPFNIRAVAVQQTMVDFDPGNMIAQNNLASAQWGLAESYWATGEVDESLDTLDATAATARISGKGGAALRLTYIRLLAHAAMRNADAGQLANARRLRDEISQSASVLQGSEPEGSALPEFADALKLRADAWIAFAAGDARSTLATAADVATRIEKIQPRDSTDELWKNATLFMANELKARSQLVLQDYPAVERSARASLAAKDLWIIDPNIDARIKATLSTLLALALAGQDRPADARTVIEPVVKMHRDLAARNHGDQLQRVEMAGALYAQALGDPQRRAALLRESAALLASLPAEMKTLASVRLWSDRVAQAMR